MDPGNQKKKRKDMGPPSKTRSLISNSPPLKRRRLLNMDSVSTQGASSSSSPSSSHSLTYDVFLSIRSEDRGSKFARKLHRNLVGKGMSTFNHRIQDPEGHAKAIEESSSFIVLLSKKYAYSESCLDELVHILECKKSKQQLVWPIFYKVEDPFEVEHQIGSFGEALAKHGNFKNNREKVSRWTRALSEVAHLSGWTFTSGSRGYMQDWLSHCLYGC
ncbi:putative TIR domain-containing protein [Rosa chinensis]|uniref:ADP-ribosyl cyclase/cyclic ADP-ribose hydrolase n=1 Tax=Rosa chinensis TaxID=74649 RepID=A0A2P6PNC4_ROSCH|nr:disease resistance protein RUN1 isoform X2 [Rosa chinensis]PRQ23443.1 putative TIR domain-containing protein [Rosa chinensis]